MLENKRIIKRIIAITLIGILTFALAGCGNQEDNAGEEIEYPIKSISAISPWPAGGGSDVSFRTYLNYMSKEMGDVDINVTNMTGGNGSLGWSAAAKAEPDGYTLALLTFDILTVEAQKLAPVSYKDFEIVNMYTNQASGLMVHGDSPWDTLEDFLEASREAKAKGEKLEIAIAGEAGLYHQAGAVMEEATGTEGAYKYIPYAGCSDQLAALLGKHLDAMIASTTAARPHIKEGSVKMLGIMSDNRSEEFPETPTFEELGYDVKYDSWRAVVAPKGTPDHVLEILREAGKKAFDNPDFQKWAVESDIGAMYLDHEKTLEYIKNQYPLVESVMEKFGLL
ncbi:MAG TPA: tripartite tricarboxylate transporter substrate binding protein [Thermoanaerobacterales bacterium]|nr:tripartite tricarboxylate transporter substrate binding protein [Thermoanaerobacterales bacterium]